MPHRLQVIVLPKGGHTASDWEDAWSIGGDERETRFAVADGATESSFAGVWASLLTAQWAAHPLLATDPVSIGAWLADVQSLWRARVDLSRLPWYAAEKAAQGAFSALLGLAVRPDPVLAGCGTWQAFALGDCCLFQFVALGDDVAGPCLGAAFPIDATAGFSNRPFLLSSRADRNDRAVASAALAAGLYAPGDRLVLASDAVAAWLLRGAEIGEDRLARLAACETPETATALLVAERAAGRMRNDDVTALVITCGGLAPVTPAESPRENGTARAGQSGARSQEQNPDRDPGHAPGDALDVVPAATTDAPEPAMLPRPLAPAGPGGPDGSVHLPSDPPKVAGP